MQKHKEMNEYTMETAWQFSKKYFHCNAAPYRQKSSFTEKIVSNKSNQKAIKFNLTDFYEPRQAGWLPGLCIIVCHKKCEKSFVRTRKQGKI